MAFRSSNVHAFAPRVRIVVVDFNGGAMTLRCLRHLSETEWPSDRLEVVLIDNGSSQQVVDDDGSTLPTVRTVRLPHNRGFASGVNAGLQDLGDVEYVALVNNDAFVEPGWLAALVGALERDPDRGAATAKVLFASPFIRVNLAVDAADGRPASSVTLSGLRIDGKDVLARTRVRYGRAGRGQVADEAGALMSLEPRAELVIPTNEDLPHPTSAELRLSTASPASLVVDAGSVEQVRVDRAPTWVTIAIDRPPVSLVNNVGTVRSTDGYGADRGFLEPDDGRFDQPCEVFAWSGCVVLLRRDFLEDVGHFDDRYFAYYEDLELAIRGKTRGWRYVYEPGAVARHLHSATGREGSSAFIFYNERNRLLTLARHDPSARVLAVLVGYVTATLSYGRSELGVWRRHRRRPAVSVFAARLRALGSFARLLPGTLRRRFADRRAPRRDRA
jgi:GT2 family glycosyltransferase